MNKLWFLRRLDLFDGMSDVEIGRVAGMFHERACRTGVEVVVKPRGDRIYLLKSGRVRVMNGDVNVAVLGPGQIFGTSALFGTAVTDQHVTALDDVVICEASVGEFLAAMTAHPGMAARVVMLLARQVFEAEDAAQHLATDPIDVRLAALLLRLADRDSSPPRVQGVSQEELAGMIGASREKVSRSIATWERERVVRARLRHIELIDETELRRRAHLA